MGKYISFGNYNKNYIYMILYLIFRALNDCIYSFGYVDIYGNICLFGENANIFFMNHALINNIFCYFGIFIFSAIMIKYELYLKNKRNDNGNKINSLNSIRLIHNSPQKSLVYKESQILLNIFLVTFLWVLEDLLISIILSNILKYIDFWSFKMLFTYLVGKKMFKFQVFRHQIFAISFISIVCSILLVISFIYSLNDKNIIYEEYPEFIPIGILIYLINIIIESFSNWDAKWLMDLKFISSNKLLMCYGILGFIINVLICIITTFVNCPNDLLGLCKAKKEERQYLDNFVIYFEDLSKQKLIIIILTFYSLTFSLKSFFYLLTIKHLTPFHVISMPTMYYFLLHIVLGIYTFVSDKGRIEDNLFKFILELSTCFLAFLSFSIFLEFIELRFCLCNYNLRKNISRRSANDSYMNYELNSSMIST